MIRPGPNDPRSSMTTVTERPVSRSVTVTCVPNGSHGWAAVSPLHGGSYHDASPASVVAPVPGSLRTPSVIEYGADRRTSGTGGEGEVPQQIRPPPTPPVNNLILG